MKKTAARKQIIGFGTWVKRTAESKWERVGFLFNDRGSASAYATKTPKAYATKVEAIRVTVTPRLPGASWADNKAS
jgi:hypothetical protein